MTTPLQFASRRPVDFSGIFIVLGALLLAAFVGLLSAYLPLPLTLLAVALPAVLVASIMRPDIGLVVALMFIFEVVPQAFQPRLPFGGGNLQAYDLLLIYLSAIVLVRSLAAGREPLRSMGAVRWPLYYLAVCMAVSLVYVKFFAPNPRVLSEARAAIAWLVVPLIVLTVTTPGRYRWFVRSVVGLALVIALYVTVQTLFGIRIMTGARVEALDNGVNSDIVRSIAGGGIYVVVFALLLLLNRLVERRVAWLWAVPASFLLVAGIVVQFGRGVWLATAAGLLVSAYLFRGIGGALRVACIGVFAIAAVLSMASVYKPRLAEAAVERAIGIREEYERGGSYNWRRQENEAALGYIERHPLFGAGLGGQYKQTSGSFSSVFFTQTLYIHNGYLFFPLKMGVFATFVPLAFIVAFAATVRRGWLRHRARDGEDRALAAALCGAFAVPVITSVTQPEWWTQPGIAAYAIFLGLALLYREMGSPLEPSAPAASPQ